MGVNPFEEYKAFMAKALEVGKGVYPTGDFVLKVRDDFKKYRDNPEYLFSAVEGALVDELHGVRQNIEPKVQEIKLRDRLRLRLGHKKTEALEKKTDVDKVAELTKLTYLSTLMLETMASRIKCVGGDLPGEIIFFKREYPSILIELDKAVKEGAKFDMGVINEITRISNRETYKYLDNRWSD